MTRAAAPRRLWRDQRFTTYWAGDAVSTMGDRISELALPLIAVSMLQASAIQVGLLVAAVWAPNLLSVVVGAWVEHRPSKKRLMVIANLIQAAAIASLPITYLVAEVTMAQLYAVALVQGAGGVLFAASSQPFFVRLVPKSAYVEANSLLSGSRSASFIVGPALGGTLIQALTAPIAMVIDAVSFLVSACAIRSVHVDESPVGTQDAGSLVRRIRSGLQFVVRHPYLWPALRCVTTCNFFSFILFAVLILFASRHLGLSPGAIGLAFGVGAVGGLLGATLAAPLARRIGTGVTIAVGSVAFSAPFLFLPLISGSTVTKCAALASVQFVSSAGVMLFDINLNSVQTAVIPDGMRSRVTGVFGTINYGIRPLGAAIGGGLAQLVGLGPVIAISAVGGSLAFLWLLGTPVLRVQEVDDLDPAEA